MRIGYDAKRIFHNTTGLGNYGRDLVRILSSTYPENNYYLYNPKPATVDRLEVDGQVLVEKQPENYFAEKIPSLWRSRGIVKQLVGDGLDVFHGLSGELPLGIEKTNIKSVVTIHDLIFIRYPELYHGIDSYIYRKKFKKAVATADAIVAISEQTKNDIVEFFGVHPDKIQVIYQGCHRAFKEKFSDEFRKKLVKKFNLPSNFILNVGTVNERKNVLSLVKAVKVSGDNLIVVGSGSAYFDEVTQFVNEHGMNKQVFFLKGLEMDELAALYQLADLFVYPSVFEGFGIPIIEALYSRTPVITTADGCFPEAGGAHSFYLKNPRDVDELTQAIAKVNDDKDLRNSMVENGFTFVQKFNDENIAAHWNTLYSDLVREE